MSSATANALDELLRPYEARPMGISREEAAERKRGTDVGKELDRIEGVEQYAAGDRLINLDALVLEVATRRLFEPCDTEAARDGR